MRITAASPVISHRAVARPASTQPVAPPPAQAPADQVVPRASGAAASSTHEVEVVKRVPSKNWSWIELLQDGNPNFVQRNFSPRQTIRDPEIAAAFGSDTPNSGKVLLHYAGDPPPGAPKHSTPVLLIHGATKNANFFWDPHEDGTGKGLPQLLKKNGFRVYAVTFAHSQDDNFLWQQQMANAITRIKQLTGSDKVDLVAHSKGGMPARMYTSDVHQPWMTPYRGDVRRLVFVAAPLGGIDYSFRHPVANYALYGDSDNPALNAPMSWETMVAWGRNVNTHDEGFSKNGPDYWPGQRQMLAEQNHPLSSIEPDWYTTYNGGEGFVSSSKGIEHYIKQGGNLIERLSHAPVDPGVEVAVMAGDSPDIAGILNEYTGPSDGILFLDSALKTTPGTNVVARQILHLNHKALVAEPEGQHWIMNALSRKTFDSRLPEVSKADLKSHHETFQKRREEHEKKVKSMVDDAKLKTMGAVKNIAMV